MFLSHLEGVQATDAPHVPCRKSFAAKKPPKYADPKTFLKPEDTDTQITDGALIAGRRKFAISILRDLQLHVLDKFTGTPRSLMATTA